MSSPQETKPSDEAIVPTAQPKRLIGESDSDDDDCDFQIIEPIPMETLDKDQKDALSLLASKVLGYYQKRDEGAVAEKKPAPRE